MKSILIFCILQGMCGKKSIMKITALQLCKGICPNVSQFVWKQNIVLKKFGETKILSSSSDWAKLIHKVYPIHPFLNDRHINAVFVSVNHSSSNISFILDQTKCPRHIMYACLFCGGFHFIDVWGIKHLWAWEQLLLARIGFFRFLNWLSFFVLWCRYLILKISNVHVHLYTNGYRLKFKYFCMNTNFRLKFVSNTSFSYGYC